MPAYGRHWQALSLEAPHPPILSILSRHTYSITPCLLGSATPILAYHAYSILPRLICSTTPNSLRERPAYAADKEGRLGTRREEMYNKAREKGRDV